MQKVSRLNVVSFGSHHLILPVHLRNYCLLAGAAAGIAAAVFVWQ